ncbi:conserved protein of unknown function [Flavobacterium collinsii]|uniref:Uncharacterized protein n=2 Tax=Flavobacterium collinsii TaxID=1114861 RepID=A0A9W4TJZ9_9FLAO|nr:conserved protein of unknown function [Flavobacterium collinsii]
MPNLFSPEKFSVYTFFEEIRANENKFIKYNSQLEIPNDVSLYHTDLDEDVIYLKIAHNITGKDMHGAMKLSNTIIRNASYYIVEKIATTEKYRKGGIATLLYKFVVELGLDFMSDSIHTTFGSKDLWQKFPFYFPEKKVYILNIKTFYKRKYNTQNEFTIWGKQSDDDFDFLEKEDKIYLLEELYSSNTITKMQKDFFVNNIENLSDKSNIRLVLE